MKKVIIGILCVLAIMVAAQEAKAQFITQAEREVMRTLFIRKTDTAPKKTTKRTPKKTEEQKPAAQPAPQTQRSTPFYLMGREGKIMAGGEYWLQRNRERQDSSAKKASNPAPKAQPKTSNPLHGMSPYYLMGREGKMMAGGEYWLQRSRAKKAEQAKQDSLQKALHKANTKALQDAQKK